MNRLPILLIVGAQHSRTVAALEAGGVWSGDDATAFQSAWADEVHRPLVIATVSLETLMAQVAQHGILIRGA